MGVFVGTSGWSYPEWSPAFYPHGLSREDYLAFYGTQLTACEINSTHYRLPSPATVTGWANAVPSTFRFAVKLHRRLTDRPSFLWDANDHEFLNRFLASLEPLGNRLAVLLIQPADDLERDDEALEENLSSLPDWLPAVVELRHPSWEAPAVRDLVARRRAAIAFTETRGAAPHTGFGDGLSYIRLRADHYDDRSRASWADAVVAVPPDHTAFVITRHDGLPPDDPSCGLGLARWLRDTV